MILETKLSDEELSLCPNWRWRDVFRTLASTKIAEEAVGFVGDELKG